MRLKTPWSDGTTHVVYEPVDFIAKLAALIPRSRKNLVLYHGVLAAHCKWRERVMCFGRSEPSEAASWRTQVPAILRACARAERNGSN